MEQFQTTREGATHIDIRCCPLRDFGVAAKLWMVVHAMPWPVPKFDSKSLPSLFRVKFSSKSSPPLCLPASPRIHFIAYPHKCASRITSILIFASSPHRRVPFRQYSVQSELTSLVGVASSLKMRRACHLTLSGSGAFSSRNPLEVGSHGPGGRY